MLAERRCARASSAARAIRIGGPALGRVEDVTPFVSEQRGRAGRELRVPIERAYPLRAEARARLGAD